MSAETELDRLREALRLCLQSIEDAYGGPQFIPEDTFEFDAAEAARGALAGSAPPPEEPEPHPGDGQWHNYEPPFPHQ